MDSGIKCTLSKFANDTKLCSAVDMPERRDAIEGSLDRLERWAYGDVMNSSKTKCKVPHLIWGSSKHKYRLCGEWTENSLAEKDFVVLDKKLGMTQQCELATQKTSYTLGCIQSSMVSKIRESKFEFANHKHE
ncbi:hypothetical protein DUI87_18142 [Hirundo rustica rustica]|uniref:Rna-directed dna polymerase from mobile element jockey-like n=1 Tax=Hirundo rustica rustica TaxID=333673 RepID=A0A3M0JVD6_HIRRU|nr:hypothetical protein DUI87_18142 [Hirundo rustica rustica]